MSGIGTKEWKNGLVALPPVRSVNFVVGIDFGAVVQAVSVASEGVDQKLRSVFSMHTVASRKDLNEKVLKMNRAVGKVDGKRRKIGHWPRASRKCR